MLTEKGLTIQSVYPNSLAEKSGLVPGDLILSVDKYKLRDPIDFIFYSTNEKFDLEINRDGKRTIFNIVREANKDFGVEFKPFKIMKCKNNCIFCFVKQLPRGLRRSLYIKDDDYRMSFIYGNYITMASLDKDDKKRIVEQRLSPLYVSVHSTNKTLRNRLLGNPKAPDILKELKFLSSNKIRFNIQIVLCPDYNDRKELRQTLSDLYRYYPYVLSIAVVPVGLTTYKKHNIRPVEKSDAESAIEIIKSFQKRFKKKYGTPVVYGSDELYLKAEYPLPSLKEYGELHQIENGVGMISLFMNKEKKIKMPLSSPHRKKYLTFTGVSFYPFLKSFIDNLYEKDHRKVMDVIPVENTFFGSSITVTGLLTGRDIIKTLLDKKEGHHKILIPDVVLNVEDKFLDDVTLNDVEDAIGIPVKKIQSTPDGLIKGITDG
jgi:putative radical SAM enzyme (TIGR03279 family)